MLISITLENSIFTMNNMWETLLNHISYYLQLRNNNICWKVQLPTIHPPIYISDLRIIETSLLGIKLQVWCLIKGCNILIIGY